MSVYRTAEVTGTSPHNFDEAIRVAVAKVAENVSQISWFEVLSQRGAVAEGLIREYQVRLLVGFRIEE